MKVPGTKSPGRGFNYKVASLQTTRGQCWLAKGVNSLFQASTLPAPYYTNSSAPERPSWVTVRQDPGVQYWRHGGNDWGTGKGHQHFMRLSGSAVSIKVADKVSFIGCQLCDFAPCKSLQWAARSP